MFNNKFDFKRDFSTKMVEMYGRSLEQSHITERYMVLGEMVREYASTHWKESKEKAVQVGAKQMFYFFNGIFDGPYVNKQPNELRDL